MSGIMFLISCYFVTCIINDSQFKQLCRANKRVSPKRKELSSTCHIKQEATDSNPKIIYQRALPPLQKTIQGIKRQKNQVIYSLQELIVGVHDQ